MHAKELAELAEDLFGKKSPLNSLHQEIAENFYPERADFTAKRPLGTDFAANLMTSYPVTCRRDLGDQFGTMLRPTARPWFHAARKFTERDETDNTVREYLEWFENTMRRAMYDRGSKFTRATKEGDHDFAAFGQTCISVELNRKADGLLYRCWHIRDMAWQENAEGDLGFVARKWKTSVQVMAATFGKDRLDEKQQKLLANAPFSDVNLLHMVVEAEMYDDNANGRPRWSIWWDVDNARMIEANPIWGKHYVIPRWQTVSSAIFGSQYSYSPAVIAALPDARLIQAMTFTLLEVGEKAANPPLLATKDAVRSDVAVFAGGITWVDKEYDERLGEAIRPLNQDFRGFNFGVQMTADTRSMLHKAFYLDALTLPERAPEMTAYEVGQRVQEYIRNALPIFEPMEHEYNAALCEETFHLMQRNGAFGSPLDWPKKLRGVEIDFRFESPLHDAIEQQKGQKWQEAQGLLSSALALDQDTGFILDAKTALRDALAGVGVPALWLRDEQEVQAMTQQRAQQQQQQQMLASLEQGSNAAANFAGASKDVAEAQGNTASRDSFSPVGMAA
jgi:hypothetical protein